MERVALAVLLVAVGPASLAAQQVAITPTVGAFIPLAPQSREMFHICGNRAGPCGLESSELALAPSPAYGVRVGLMFDRVVGVEATLAMSATEMRRTQGVESSSDFLGNYSETEALSASSTIMALRLTLQRSLGWANIVGAFGVARVEFSGTGYDTWGGNLDRLMHGPTVGGRLEIPVTRFAKAELGVTGHFYRMTIDQGRQPDIKMTQNDWLLQSGFTIGL